jgi:hypothetical protein
MQGHIYDPLTMAGDPEGVYPAPIIADNGSDKGSGSLEAPASAASSKAIAEDGRTRKKRLQLSCGECRRKKVRDAKTREMLIFSNITAM